MLHRPPMSRPLPAAIAVALAAATITAPLRAAELVQGVRSKLSAADLASGEAAVEAYRLAKGVDPEYLSAVGWLARGAEMLGRRDKAAAWVADDSNWMPQKMNTMAMAPRNTAANQPVNLSRICCSMGKADSG